METSSDTRTKTPVLLRILRVFIVLFIAVGIAWALFVSREKPAKQDIAQVPQAVKVIEAHPVSKVMSVEAFGTVKPRTLVKIAAEVPGRIDYIHPSFIEGGQVKAGELLIRIDQRSFKLDREAGKVRLHQAKTDIKSLKQDIENLKQDIALSQANMDLAQKELERIRALNKNQFASKTMLDRAEQQYLQAKIALQNIQNRMVMTGPMMEQKKAALSMAEVDFQKADLAYRKARIVSPFDGWVLNKLLEEGEYVNPGQVIGSIYEKNALDVDVSIPLEKMKWINPVLEKGEVPGALVSIASSEGIVSHAWPAKVARFKANIDEKTRTLTMTLEIDTSAPEKGGVFGLKPGVFVTCSIQGTRFENIFVLPRYLLKTGDILFTINDNHLMIKKVDILRKFEEEVYIQAGLNPGDRIISSPLPGAREGMPLTIKTNGK